VPHVERPAGVDAQREGGALAPGLEDLAVDGRDEPHLGPARAEADGGSVGDEPRADGGEHDALRRAHEPPGDVVEADRDRPVGLHLRPRVTAVVEAVEGEGKADAGGRRGRGLSMSEHLERRVLAAAPAVERVLADAAGRLAGELVPAGAGRGGQLLEVRVPRHGLETPPAGGTEHPPGGDAEAPRDRREHGVEGPEEGEVVGVPGELG
jgi:hypothetical protein